MDKLKSLEEILAGNTQTNEVYSSDASRRFKRGKRGIYARSSFDFINLLRSWDEVVGNLMAQNTVPLKIKNQFLVIATKHAVFANELRMISPQILEKIWEKFPQLKSKVSKLKFYHSEYNAVSFKKKKLAVESNAPQETLHPFSPMYRKKINEAKSLFQDIDDEEVKKSLTQYLLQKK